MPTSKRRLAAIAIKAIIPSLLLVSGCAPTTITSSSNPSRDRQRLWRDYTSLPVIILGNSPQHSHAELASMYPAAQTPYSDSDRHIVFYLNAAALPQPADLCSDMSAFQAGTQTGESASVTGAMCDGKTVVTTATGRVLTQTKTARWLRKDFDTVRDQLYQSLVPGSNDPNKFRTN